MDEIGRTQTMKGCIGQCMDFAFHPEQNGELLKDSEQKRKDWLIFLKE